MESAMLYTCWKKLPRIIGIAKTVNALRGGSMIKYSSFDILHFSYNCIFSTMIYRLYFITPHLATTSSV